MLGLPALVDGLGPTARLTVVGDGTLRAEVERACARFGDRVRFTGRVPHEDVARHLGDADIAIEPAPRTGLNDRSTMIKIGEYLAAGLPTVAYRLRETEATARDAVLYADDAAGFADAIALLAGDEELRRSLATRALAAPRRSPGNAQPRRSSRCIPSWRDNGATLGLRNSACALRFGSNGWLSCRSSSGGGRLEVRFT